MNEIPAEEFAPVTKLRFSGNGRYQLITLGFATLITLVILVTVYTTSYIQQSLKTPTNTTAIDQATWVISRVEPNPGSATDVNITVTSSIGNVRTYTGVRSYGISNDRQMLVTSSATALNLIKLSDNTRVKLSPPFDYSGDQGQAISWTRDDKYFALAVYKGQNTADSHVVVYDSTGKFFRDLTGLFASRSVNGNTFLYPVKFSSAKNLFIARVYKADDVTYYKSQSLTIDQLPVTLRVYNLEGKAMKEVSVRDAATTASQVIYFWDQTGNYLTYLVTGNNEVNYADAAQFTKVLAE